MTGDERDLVLRAATVMRNQAVVRTELARARKRNAELRARVARLEASRDRWRLRATGYRTELNTLRMKVLWLVESRDAWKAKARS